MPRLDDPGIDAVLARLTGWRRDGDVLVVTQKIVSKAEGRVVSLNGIEPSEQALCWLTSTNESVPRCSSWRPPAATRPRRSPPSRCGAA